MDLIHVHYFKNFENTVKYLEKVEKKNLESTTWGNHYKHSVYFLPKFTSLSSLFYICIFKKKEIMDFFMQSHKKETDRQIVLGI
jgi:hypothetical protein